MFLNKTFNYLFNTKLNMFELAILQYRGLNSNKIQVQKNFKNNFNPL